MKIIPRLVCLLALALSISCSSSRPTLSNPPAESTATPSTESQPAEAQPEAMASAESAPSAGGTGISSEAESRRIDGLVEYGRAMLRGKKPRGSGVGEVTPATFSWTAEKDKERNFTLRAEVIKTVTMNCAKQAGENLCLEIRIKTLTDNEYFFRDKDWEAGGNTQITALLDAMKTHYPKVVFDMNLEDTVR